MWCCDDKIAMILPFPQILSESRESLKRKKYKLNLKVSICPKNIATLKYFGSVLFATVEYPEGVLGGSSTPSLSVLFLN